MAAPKKGGRTAQARNDNRKCGKAMKQNPGEPAGRNNGKTQGGYSPEKAAARAATRRLSA